jgi:hypothetical protein
VLFYLSERIVPKSSSILTARVKEGGTAMGIWSEMTENFKSLLKLKSDPVAFRREVSWK